MSQELMLIMAKALPIEMIIEKLAEAATECKITMTEDAKKSVSMYAMLFLSKEVVEAKGLEKTMEDAARATRIHERTNQQ